MPLKTDYDMVPYGDTQVPMPFTECDGTCNEDCYNGECGSAAKCPFCDEVYCTDEHDGCPNKCEEEE